MADLKEQLSRLQEDHNILKMRAAKYAGNIPLDLIHTIEDHETTIDLTIQAINGQIDLAAYEAQMKPLLVSLSQAQVYIDQRGQQVDTQYNAGRDQYITNIYNESARPAPTLYGRATPGQLCPPRSRIDRAR